MLESSNKNVKFYGKIHEVSVVSLNRLRSLMDFSFYFRDISSKELLIEKRKEILQEYPTLENADISKKWENIKGQFAIEYIEIHLLMGKKYTDFNADSLKSSIKPEIAKEQAYLHRLDKILKKLSENDRQTIYDREYTDQIRIELRSIQLVMMLFEMRILSRIQSVSQILQLFESNLEILKELMSFPNISWILVEPVLIIAAFSRGYQKDYKGSAVIFRKAIKVVAKLLSMDIFQERFFSTPYKKLKMIQLLYFCELKLVKAMFEVQHRSKESFSLQQFSIRIQSDKLLNAQQKQILFAKFEKIYKKQQDILAKQGIQLNTSSEEQDSSMGNQQQLMGISPMQRSTNQKIMEMMVAEKKKQKQFHNVINSNMPGNNLFQRANSIIYTNPPGTSQNDSNLSIQQLESRKSFPLNNNDSMNMSMRMMGNSPQSAVASTSSPMQLNSPQRMLTVSMKRKSQFATGLGFYQSEDSEKMSPLSARRQDSIIDDREHKERVERGNSKSKSFIDGEEFYKEDLSNNNFSEFSMTLPHTNESFMDRYVSTKQEEEIKSTIELADHQKNIHTQKHLLIERIQLFKNRKGQALFETEAKPKIQEKIIQSESEGKKKNEGIFDSEASLKGVFVSPRRLVISSSALQNNYSAQFKQEKPVSQPLLLSHKKSNSTHSKIQQSGTNLPQQKQQSIKSLTDQLLKDYSVAAPKIKRITSAFNSNQPSRQISPSSVHITSNVIQNQHMWEALSSRQIVRTNQAKSLHVQVSSASNLQSSQQKQNAQQVYSAHFQQQLANVTQQFPSSQNSKTSLKATPKMLGRSLRTSTTGEPISSAKWTPSPLQAMIGTDEKQRNFFESENNNNSEVMQAKDQLERNQVSQELSSFSTERTNDSRAHFQKVDALKKDLIMSSRPRWDLSSQSISQPSSVYGFFNKKEEEIVPEQRKDLAAQQFMKSAQEIDKLIEKCQINMDKKYPNSLEMKGPFPNLQVALKNVEQERRLQQMSERSLSSELVIEIHKQRVKEIVKYKGKQYINSPGHLETIISDSSGIDREQTDPNQKYQKIEQQFHQYLAGRSQTLFQNPQNQVQSAATPQASQKSHMLKRTPTTPENMLQLIKILSPDKKTGSTFFQSSAFGQPTTERIIPSPEITTTQDLKVPQQQQSQQLLKSKIPTFNTLAASGTLPPTNNNNNNNSQGLPSPSLNLIASSAIQEAGFFKDEDYVLGNITSSSSKSSNLNESIPLENKGSLFDEGKFLDIQAIGNLPANNLEKKEKEVFKELNEGIKTQQSINVSMSLGDRESQAYQSPVNANNKNTFPKVFFKQPQDEDNLEDVQKEKYVKEDEEEQEDPLADEYMHLNLNQVISSPEENETKKTIKSSSKLRQGKTFKAKFQKQKALSQSDIQNILCTLQKFPIHYVDFESITKSTDKYIPEIIFMHSSQKGLKLIQLSLIENSLNCSYFLEIRESNLVKKLPLHFDFTNTLGFQKISGTPTVWPMAFLSLKKYFFELGLSDLTKDSVINEGLLQFENTKDSMVARERLKDEKSLENSDSIERRDPQLHFFLSQTETIEVFKDDKFEDSMPRNLARSWQNGMYSLHLDLENRSLLRKEDAMNICFIKNVMSKYFTFCQREIRKESGKCLKVILDQEGINNIRLQRLVQQAHGIQRKISNAQNNLVNRMVAIGKNDEQRGFGVMIVTQVREEDEEIENKEGGQKSLTKKKRKLKIQQSKFQKNEMKGIQDWVKQLKRQMECLKHRKKALLEFLSKNASKFQSLLEERLHNLSMIGVVLIKIGQHYQTQQGAFFLASVQLFHKKNVSSQESILSEVLDMYYRVKRPDNFYLSITARDLNNYVVTNPIEVPLISIENPSFQRQLPFQLTQMLMKGKVHRGFIKMLTKIISENLLLVRQRGIEQNIKNLQNQTNYKPVYLVFKNAHSEENREMFSGPNSGVDSDLPQFFQDRAKDTTTSTPNEALFDSLFNNVYEKNFLNRKGADVETIFEKISSQQNEKAHLLQEHDMPAPEDNEEEELEDEDDNPKNFHHRHQRDNTTAQNTFNQLRSPELSPNINIAKKTRNAERQSSIQSEESPRAGTPPILRDNLASKQSKSKPADFSSLVQLLPVANNLNNASLESSFVSSQNILPQAMQSQPKQISAIMNYSHETYTKLRISGGLKKCFVTVCWNKSGIFGRFELTERENGYLEVNLTSLFPQQRFQFLDMSASQQRLAWNMFGVFEEKMNDLCLSNRKQFMLLQMQSMCSKTDKSQNKSIIGPKKTTEASSQRLILQNNSSIQYHLSLQTKEFLQFYSYLKQQFTAKVANIGRSFIVTYCFLINRKELCDKYPILFSLMMYPIQSKTSAHRAILSLQDLQNIEPFFAQKVFSKRMSRVTIDKAFRIILSKVVFVQTVIGRLPIFHSSIVTRNPNMFGNSINPKESLRSISYEGRKLSGLVRRNSIRLKTLQNFPEDSVDTGTTFLGGGNNKAEQEEEHQNWINHVNGLRCFRNGLSKINFDQKVLEHTSQNFLDEEVLRYRLIYSSPKVLQTEYIIISVYRDLLLQNWLLKFYFPRNCRTLQCHIDQSDLFQSSSKFLKKTISKQIIWLQEYEYTATFSNYLDLSRRLDFANLASPPSGNKLNKNAQNNGKNPQNNDNLNPEGTTDSNVFKPKWKKRVKETELFSPSPIANNRRQSKIFTLKQINQIASSSVNKSKPKMFSQMFYSPQQPIGNKGEASSPNTNQMSRFYNEKMAAETAKNISSSKSLSHQSSLRSLHHQNQRQQQSTQQKQSRSQQQSPLLPIKQEQLSQRKIPAIQVKQPPQKNFAGIASAGVIMPQNEKEEEGGFREYLNKYSKNESLIAPRQRYNTSIPKMTNAFFHSEREIGIQQLRKHLKAQLYPNRVSLGEENQDEPQPFPSPIYEYQGTPSPIDEPELEDQNGEQSHIISLNSIKQLKSIEEEIKTKVQKNQLSQKNIISKNNPNEPKFPLLNLNLCMDKDTSLQSSPKNINGSSQLPSDSSDQKLDPQDVQQSKVTQELPRIPLKEFQEGKNNSKTKKLKMIIKKHMAGTKMANSVKNIIEYIKPTRFDKITRIEKLKNITLIQDSFFYQMVKVPEGTQYIRGQRKKIDPLKLKKNEHFFEKKIWENIIDFLELKHTCLQVDFGGQGLNLKEILVSKYLRADKQNENYIEISIDLLETLQKKNMQIQMQTKGIMQDFEINFKNLLISFMEQQQQKKEEIEAQHQKTLEVQQMYQQQQKFQKEMEEEQKNAEKKQDQITPFISLPKEQQQQDDFLSDSPVKLQPKQNHLTIPSQLPQLQKQSSSEGGINSESEASRFRQSGGRSLKKTGVNYFFPIEYIQYAATSQFNFTISHMNLNVSTIQDIYLNCREITNVFIAEGYFKFQANYIYSNISYADLCNLAQFILYKIRSSNFLEMLYDKSEQKRIQKEDLIQLSKKSVPPKYDKKNIRFINPQNIVYLYTKLIEPRKKIYLRASLSTHDLIFNLEVVQISSKNSLKVQKTFQHIASVIPFLKEHFEMGQISYLLKHVSDHYSKRLTIAWYLKFEQEKAPFIGLDEQRLSMAGSERKVEFNTTKMQQQTKQ